STGWARVATSGHRGRAAAQRVSTRSVPSRAIPFDALRPLVALPRLAAPGGRASVPAVRHVVRAPAAGASPDLTTKKQFEGLPENGWSPSDSNGAVGTYNYLETVNESFRISSRAGAAQYTSTFQSWFGLSGSVFDPVTQWDAAGHRFMFVVTTGSSLVLSVAQQENALGSYCNYTFTTPSGYFADYEKLGVDG